MADSILTPEELLGKLLEGREVDVLRAPRSAHLAKPSSGAATGTCMLQPPPAPGPAVMGRLGDRLVSGARCRLGRRAGAYALLMAPALRCSRGESSPTLSASGASSIRVVLRYQ